MPVTAIAPADPSTVTVPGAPSKTAKPGCGAMAPLLAPFMSVQLVEVTLQVPEPPSTAPLPADPAASPSQKDRLGPIASTRLTCPATEVCTLKSVAVVPPGTIPISSPWSVSVPP